MSNRTTNVTINGRRYRVESTSWLTDWTITDHITELLLTPDAIMGAQPTEEDVKARIAQLADELDGGMIEEYFVNRRHLLEQAVGRAFLIGGRWIRVAPSQREEWRYSREAWDVMAAGDNLTTADPFSAPPTLEQVTSYLTPRKRRLEALMVSRGIVTGPDYQYEDVYAVLHGADECPRYVGIMHDETYSFLYPAPTLHEACAAMASRLGEDTGGSISCVWDLDEDEEIYVEAQVTVRRPGPPMPVEVQQPGTHRELIHVQWSETNSYEDEFEIDVPDGYDGDLSDLLDVDDTPFEEGQVEGVPAGYTSKWLDRAGFNMTDTNDRQFDESYKVE